MAHVHRLFHRLLAPAGRGNDGTVPREANSSNALSDGTWRRSLEELVEAIEQMRANVVASERGGGAPVPAVIPAASIDCLPEHKYAGAGEVVDGGVEDEDGDVRVAAKAAIELMSYAVLRPYADCILKRLQASYSARAAEQRAAVERSAEAHALLMVVLATMPEKQRARDHPNSEMLSASVAEYAAPNHSSRRFVTR